MMSESRWSTQVLSVVTGAWLVAAMPCAHPANRERVDSMRPVVLDLPAILSPRCQQGVLLGIAAAGNRLVAVGERGCIVYSDDNGKRWQQARVPVSATLTAVTFASPTQGWAVGTALVTAAARAIPDNSRRCCCESEHASHQGPA